MKKNIESTIEELVQPIVDARNIEIVEIDNNEVEFDKKDIALIKLAVKF